MFIIWILILSAMLGATPGLRTFVWVEELAEELDVPLATLRHWRRLGKGPKAFLVGRRLAYDRRDVTEWIEQQRENAS